MANGKPGENEIATELEVKRNNMFFFPFSKLDIVPELNIRTDYGDIEELVSSIMANGTIDREAGTLENGVINAVIGYRKNGRGIVIHGHRRLRAGSIIKERFGLEVIYKFNVEDGDITDDQRVIDMVSTNTGEPLKPLEWAEAVRRLLSYEVDGKKKYTIKSVAAKLGKTPVYITNLTKLLEAPEEFKALVSQNVISGTLAIDLIKEGPEAVEGFVKDYKAGKFNEESEGEEDNPDTEQGPAKPTRIVAKNLKKTNSIKNFKGFAKSLVETDLTPEKAEVYKFIQKMLANKVTAKELNQFFFPAAE